ncbi:hypothetical protein DCAR_0100420 [Daucus carota subsp. sativus]|uniref:WRKY domain-containing protein n=1 Tax=Daucus carota subsp. sativus TaxID=79200 RepID=A0AAF0W0S9_DAUCS|nr:PREDICTED: WRKY transcription factor 22 [Daucus carota subsp. sativus]WOG81274.1 hypothetical protein DCAR_0100420 [Daucus carota subsp. sativus]
MEEDWGLQAIVRACSHDQCTTDSVLDQYNYRDDLFYDFPEFEELKNNDCSLIVDELDDRYKPFFHDPTPTPISSFSSHLENSDSQGCEVKLEQEVMLKVMEQHETAPVAKPKALTPAAKYKRKKQQKRVVVQVTSDGLSSDLWAWRKYGQKPIKGSPYPRSYYRCSSSKGCPARRQVEESCSDPGMYIITYSAEHNHAQPTRRSSLAGTNRQKFSTLKRTCSDESCVSSMHVDQVQSLKKIKHEKKDDTIDEQSRGQNLSGLDREFVIEDSILTENFFEVLDDLDGLVSYSSLHGFYSQ